MAPVIRMTVFQLAEMTYEEVRALEAARVVAILPAGAIEAHGPHLPLSTDVIIAEAMARAGAEKLAARGYLPLILPALIYSVADFAAGFPGTISPSRESVTGLVSDIARSLSKQGFPALTIANAHLDPDHIASIEAATAAARAEDLLTIVFPDISKKPWALMLTDEFKSGACHAGQYEGSIVLAERPELVREEIRKGLAANLASLSQAIRAGVKSFEAADGPRAYFGSPAAASAAEGRRTIDVLGSILEEAVLNELGE